MEQQANCCPHDLPFAGLADLVSWTDMHSSNGVPAKARRWT